MKQLIKKTLLLLLTGLALSACTKDALPEKVIRPVVTQQVDIRENCQQSSYAGEVKARYKMSLGFRIGGKIVERFVEVGNVVVPGTLLARLDPEDFKLQLMMALVFSGALAFRDLGQAEDPDFTIKLMAVKTFWPRVGLYFYIV